MENDNSNTKQLNEPAATSSKNQETKPPLPKNNIIEIKQTITAAKDLDFVPAIHQIQPVPLFNYQRSRPTYISPFLKFFPAIYQDIYSFKRSEMIFSKEYYEQLKNIFTLMCTNLSIIILVKKMIYFFWRLIMGAV